MLLAKKGNHLLHQPDKEGSHIIMGVNNTKKRRLKLIIMRSRLEEPKSIILNKSIINRLKKKKLKRALTLKTLSNRLMKIKVKIFVSVTNFTIRS